MQSVEFPNMTDEEVISYLIEHCYPVKEHELRKLPDGEWIMLYRLAFTWSVCCGVGMHSMFKYRWCFEDKAEAEHFFNTCQNYDDIPVKRNSLKGHRYLDKPLYMEYDELGYEKW